MCSRGSSRRPAGWRSACSLALARDDPRIFSFRRRIGRRRHSLPRRRPVRVRARSWGRRPRNAVGPSLLLPPAPGLSPSGTTRRRLGCRLHDRSRAPRYFPPPLVSMGDAQLPEGPNERWELAVVVATVSGCPRSSSASPSMWSATRQHWLRLVPENLVAHLDDAGLRRTQPHGLRLGPRPRDPRRSDQELEAVRSRPPTPTARRSDGHPSVDLSGGGVVPTYAASNVVSSLPAPLRNGYGSPKRPLTALALAVGFEEVRVRRTRSAIARIVVRLDESAARNGLGDSVGA